MDLNVRSTIPFADPLAMGAFDTASLEWEWLDK
jgi:hypothetical protein